MEELRQPETGNQYIEQVCYKTKQAYIIKKYMLVDHNYQDYYVCHVHQNESRFSLVYMIYTQAYPNLIISIFTIIRKI